MEFEFTLKFKLAPEASDADDLIERLGAAGCTDALAGLGVAGHLGMEFVREADSAEEAILSALDDVNLAIPGARLVEAGPDFVGLTDVADLMGVSRQNMRKLMVNNPAQFPSPVHGGSSSIWHLAQVLQFMHERKYQVAQSIHAVARAAMQINLVKESALLDRAVEAKVRQRMLA